jgi:RecA-family ATPase
VPGYVVEGLTVFGGKPKVGKSWWAYDVCIAVAVGGMAMGAIECEQGDVLYLCLEDNRRRVKNRINVVRPYSDRLGGLERLSIRTRAPRVDEGLLKEIEKWRIKAEKPRLVVIDVWIRVRPRRQRGADLYAADYAAAEPLQRPLNTGSA